MPGPRGVPPIERLDLLGICNDQAMMDSLRVLMLVAILLLALVWFWDRVDLRKERGAKPKPSVGEDCKLHSRKRKDCPPGSHDE